MRVPGICIDCGRTISRDFIYCPWCGCSQLEKDLVPVGASSGKKTVSSGEGEPARKKTRLSRINSMLDDLERDMTIFMMRRERNR
ncbi:MAG: zinc ribbon domain-containing protein [Treponemataceae bacterium]|nr:zinc ribbon domain-containing protein [Treponemataceae bacterium]